MTPAEYDAWYETLRGRWFGDTEFRLLVRLLDLHPSCRLLDVGCGTGWFTRRFAAVAGVKVTGVDRDSASLIYARAHDTATAYLQADAESLPFSEKSFDLVVSIAALCFIPNWPSALKEIVRVSRTRFVVGTLNRASLLWRQKSWDGGLGAYRGAHWHTRAELRSVLATLPVTGLRFYSAVFLPSGSAFARFAENILPGRFPFGALLVVTGTKAKP